MVRQGGVKVQCCNQMTWVRGLVLLVMEEAKCLILWLSHLLVHMIGCQIWWVCMILKQVMEYIGLGWKTWFMKL